MEGWGRVGGVLATLNPRYYWLLSRFFNVVQTKRHTDTVIVTESDESDIRQSRASMPASWVLITRGQPIATRRVADVVSMRLPMRYRCATDFDAVFGSGRDGHYQDLERVAKF